MLWLALILVPFALVGCGGSPEAAPPPKTATAAPPPSSAPAEKKAEDAPEEVSAGIPEECAKNAKSDLCVPGNKWSNHLCEGVHPNIALYLFRKGTPWQRLYLTRDTDAWNASGGASVAGKVVFDEEVLVLRFRGNETGIQVTGANGSYDALRWDGSCVSLQAEEVTKRLPPDKKHARVMWKDMEESVREAMRGDDKLMTVLKVWKKECKGVTMGDVTKACEKADGKFSHAIVEYVRGGGNVPIPNEKP